MDTIFFISLTGLGLSIVAIMISILSWHKSRAVYGLERMKFTKDSGKGRSDKQKEWDDKLIEKLKTGKYTIVTHYEPAPDRDYNLFVLGKIKK